MSTFGTRLLSIPSRVAEADDDDDDGGRNSLQHCALDDEDWTLLLPDLPLFAASILLALASSVIGILFSRAVGELVDAIKDGMSERSDGPVLGGAHAMRAISGHGMKLVYICVAEAITSFLSSTALSIATERLVDKLRTRVFLSFLRSDVEFFDSASIDSLDRRLSNDIEEVRRAVKHSVSSGVTNAMTLCGGVGSIYAISPRLTGLLLSSIGGMALVGQLYGRFLIELSRRIRGKKAEAASCAAESLRNIRTVKHMTSEAYEEEKYRALSTEAAELTTRMGVYHGMLHGLTALAAKGLMLLVLWYGGSMVGGPADAAGSGGAISGGDLMAFVMHSFSLQRSSRRLIILYEEVVRGYSAGLRVIDAINNHPRVVAAAAQDDGGGGRERAAQRERDRPFLSGDVRFTNVTFRYPSRDQRVLRNFHLHIPPNKVVALVGASGAGKSTVAQLLERFYDPQEGEITLDGVPLTQLDPHWLRSHIGMVGQEPVLFSTSVRDNILYGRRDASQEDVERAARIANCHDFIRSFPSGYDTVVGDRGVQLSGGQKQRIAIATAVLKDPKILILDEATSALDAESEHAVQDALSQLMRGRTVLLIAHRLSTVKSADIIAVVKDGQVVEMGSHDELMSATPKSEYARLVEKQSGEDVLP